jgi:DNA modification methylase
MIKFSVGDAFYLLPQIASQSYDMILTDPPYNFTKEEMRCLQDHFLRISKSWVIVFCPPQNLWIDKPDQTLFWTKPLSTKNTRRHYSNSVEEIYIYRDGYWDNSRHWSNYVNVFPDYVEDAKIHPHKKPLSLIRRLVLNHCPPGGSVLDPFCGTGVVGEACSLTGRDFFGIDITSDYMKKHWRGIQREKARFVWNRNK